MFFFHLINHFTNKKDDQKIMVSFSTKKTDKYVHSIMLMISHELVL